LHILITGATGFIGKPLVRRLCQQNHIIYLVTRDSCRVPQDLRKCVIIIEADIRNRSTVMELVISIPTIDVIIHAAALLDYFGSWQRLYGTNVIGTQNILDIAILNGAGHFVFISSIEATGPIAEPDIPAGEAAPCQPVSRYGQSKLQAEEVVCRISELHRLPYTILRLGNVYGPNSSNFLVSIAESMQNRKANKLRKFLPAYQERYIHPVFINDVVNGIVKSFSAPSSGNTYFIAGKEYLRIGKIFQEIGTQLGLSIDPIARPFKHNLYLSLRNRLLQIRCRADLLAYFTTSSGNRLHRAYSIKKAERDFDYAPEVSLARGIRDTMGVGFEPN